MASVSAGPGSSPSSIARANPGGVFTVRPATARAYPAPARCRRPARRRTWLLMAASSAFSGANEASKRSRLRRKMDESFGSALVRAAEMAAATLGTSGMSYQRWGLGSLPVTWRTWPALTMRRAAAVRTEEGGHPAVVAGAVLDDHAGLGQLRRVGRVRLEEMGVCIGIGDQRRHRDGAAPQLLGDVTPEVLGRHHIDDPVRRGGTGRGGGDRAQRAGGAQRGDRAQRRTQEGGRGASTSCPRRRSCRAHNGNNNRNHFG